MFLTVFNLLTRNMAFPPCIHNLWFFHKYPASLTFRVYVCVCVCERDRESTINTVIFPM